MRQQTCLFVVALLVAAVVAQAQQARQGSRLGVLLYDWAPPGLLDAFGGGIRPRRASGPSGGQCDRRQFDASRVQRQECRVRQRDSAGPRARGGAL